VSERGIILLPEGEKAVQILDEQLPSAKQFEMELGGRKLIAEIGQLAQQASGSALIRYGETEVLVTATMSKEPREGVDFFPLTVDYEERLYAVGRIPGGFVKREGRPAERAILAARLTDRPLRPLFPDGFRNEIQVVTTVMATDYDNKPELCSLIGASVALSISEIPFDGPIGAVEIGYIDGEYVINPTSEQLANSALELVVAGTKDAVLMVEAGAQEVPEEVILEAIMFGHQEIMKIVDWITKIQQAVGKEKVQVKPEEVEPELVAAVENIARSAMQEAIMNNDKAAREAAIEDVKAHTKEMLAEQYPDQAKNIDAVLRQILKAEVRKSILERGIRPDGRTPYEIRPIACQVGLLRRTHGSGLFTRGQTQVMTITTLGPISDVQHLDGLGQEEFKRYLHHYNFPPYSVGETRPMRGPGRREIGHGALAERALLPVIPDQESFPYTIRLVSEVVSSNGSTSMASVCGSTLALMDAGVPIKAPVAGVAMGLVKDEKEVVVLTDIQGIEDALGDMDFKVAGTKEGVTAIQMDMKIAGIDRDVLAKALAIARESRLLILQRMLETIAEPRAELSPYAPRMIVEQIDPDKIRDVIGPGGKMINKIINETGVEIDIEDDGRIFIAAVDQEAGERARQWIRDLTQDVEVGRIYRGKVARIMNFGAFVEILPGKEGLVHISQLAEGRVGKVEDVVSVGDEIEVKVTEIDNLGRINLSRKEVLLTAKGETADNGDRTNGQRRNGPPRRRRR
jgi:polyribonucleotide nucleotidyltransferase